MQKNIILAVIIGVLGLGSFAAGRKVEQNRRGEVTSPLHISPASNLIAKNQFNPGLTIMDFDYDNSKTNNNEVFDLDKVKIELLL